MWCSSSCLLAWTPTSVSDLILIWFVPRHSYWGKIIVLLFSARELQEGTNPQIQAIRHTKLSQADGLETGPAQAHLEGCWLGDVGRVGWPHLPPPWRQPGAEVSVGRQQFPPTLSDLSTPFSPCLGQGLPAFAPHHQRTACTFSSSLQISPWELPLSSGSVPKQQGSRGLPVYNQQNRYSQIPD